MMEKPKFFKYAMASGGLTKLSSALSISVNTLLVALGASALQIGAVNSIKSLGEVFSQYFGLYYLNLFTSRKKAEIVSMILTGLPDLLLIAIALKRPNSWFLLIMAISFFSKIISRASYLCWFSWMGEIVPAKFKNYFFGTRSYFGEIFGIVGYFIAFAVLKVQISTLILLSILIFLSFLVGNLELATYFFHPDSKRERLEKNNILRRIHESSKDKKFIKFISWINLLNAVLVCNTLFMEYFMIHSLNLKYYWIPISFVVISLGTAAALLVFRNFLIKFTYRRRIFCNLLILISCFLWIITKSPTILIGALFIHGMSLGLLGLIQKVEIIEYAKNNDKESHYALFNFVQPVFVLVFTMILTSFQIFKFNFLLVFFITLPLALISLLFSSKDDCLYVDQCARD